MEPVSIVFYTSFGIPASGIYYDWSILTVYVNSYVKLSLSRAQSQINMASV